MRILGIDPGSGATGYGIIDAGEPGSELRLVTYGAIPTNPKKPFHERLLTIHRGLNEVVAGVAKPDAMAIEGVFHAANVQSALRLGHARGVALLVAAEHGMTLHEYAPLEIKGAVVGYGRADKSQVQAMVRLILRMPSPPTPDHAADALAAAICHANRLRFPAG
ncbi:MAG: crossover junction endodeoxyribonuclease RuvC [Acidobacteriota bacterium]|jgi:crossover junction endodeoxyribonuclease RuvC|nr:crossover junction endodeoxyribonuclease RuvC [Acidobacteriota bacterium]